jgi:hypothetical protein
MSFSYIQFWFCVLILLLAVIALLARYCYRVAKRTGRSRVGFVCLSLLFPAVAWIICLILDKDESRYTDTGREKNPG